MKRFGIILTTCCSVALLTTTGCGKSSDSNDAGAKPSKSGSSSSDTSKSQQSEPSSSGSAGSSASSVGTAAAASGGTVDTAANLAKVAKELTVSGPVDGGKGTPFSATSADLGAAGYSEKEFFFEGPTTSYTMDGGATMDGKWTLKEATKSAFKSRLLVRRPLDASKFNGTVVVEWLNVSGGADGDPGFMYNSDLILREGYAYVGVSAQQVGVQGGGLSLGSQPGAVPLTMADPERYGSLTHPGDAYSFDIFTQAAKAIREPQDADVLEGLKPKLLIAYGESQSAGRMVGYVNGAHVRDKVYDGFFIHSRGASGTPYSDGAAATGGFGGIDISMFTGGGAHLIRDDIDEKVFQFQTETDVTGMLAFLPARQPDTDKLRTWEVAGTSHADQFIVDFNASMVTGGSLQCDGANNGPQYRVIRAALKSLQLWLKDGTAPATGKVLETDSSGKSLRDEHGNALGGVRSPDVDVPNRTLSGDPAMGAGAGSFWCFLFGSNTPFTAEKLKSLYPTHDEYVSKVERSAQQLREAGFLLQPEADGFIHDAQEADIPPK
jgi:hypothetical protein